MVADSDDSEEMKKLMEDHDKLVEEIFQHEDKDKNGFISHEEFSGPKHDELWGIPKKLGLQPCHGVSDENQFVTSRDGFS